MPLGGLRTGSLLGSGLAVVGWAYPVLLVSLAIPAFLFGRCLAKKLVLPDQGVVVVLSPIVVVGLYGSTFYLTSAASGCDNVAVLLVIRCEAGCSWVLSTDRPFTARACLVDSSAGLAAPSRFLEMVM